MPQISLPGTLWLSVSSGFSKLRKVMIAQLVLETPMRHSVNAFQTNLVEHWTGIAEVMGSNAVQALFFQTLAVFMLDDFNVQYKNGKHGRCI